MVNPAPPIQAAAMQQPAQFDDWQSDTVMQEEILNSLNHLAHSVRAIAREMTRAPRPPFYKRHYKPLVAAIALGTLVYCYPTATQNLISNVQNISAQALNQTLAAMPQGVKDFGSTVFNQTVAITPQPIQDFTVNLATSVKDTTVATAQTALDLWDIAGRIHQLVRLGKDVLVTANRVAEGIAFAAGIPAAMLNGAVNGIIYNINPLESLTTGKIIGMGGINIISYEALDIFVKYSKRLPVIRRIVNNIPVAEISAPLFKISLAVYKCFNRIPVIGRVMRILPLSDRDRHGDRPLEMTAPLFKIAAAVYITANTALDPSFGLSDLFDHQTYKKMYNYAVTSVKDRVNYVITSAGNVYNYVTSPATVNAASQKASDTWVTITSAQTYTDLYDYLRS
ncbi:MAG TPA: hypothetical protein VLH77_04365, partial [Gammaproteobacteria bacterium]|nr:hypothetical protein [Gammaproteobacteria bacterium]